MSTDFLGKTVVVTGAAQGIGRAIADQLLPLGAQVIGLDYQFKKDEYCTESKMNESRRWHLHLDITQSSEVRETIAHIEQHIGPIDYFVHAAGILRTGNVLDISEEDWTRTFSTNCDGAFYLMRAIGQLMKERKTGAMVAIGSNASMTPRLGMGAYAASKAALTMMMKCLALELAEYNIRCNVIAPGSTDTPMQRQLCKDNSAREQLIKGSNEQYRLGIPLQRIALPEQIAQVALFLLSDKASHITMEVLRVDGGATFGSH